MNTVQGKNIKGFMKVDALYYNIFCGQTLSFGLEQDELETSTVGNGSMRTYDAGFGNAMMEVGGVTILDNSESRIAITYLQQQSIRQQIQDWSIELTDDNNNIVTYLFRGIIRSSNFDKSIPGFSKSAVSIRVSGNITMTTVAPPIGSNEITYSDWWNMAAGETKISGTSTQLSYNLIGCTVLEVDREGTQYDIVTSGTPGNRQAKHNNTTGDVDFDTANPSVGETVFVLFRR
jgi:hypothetical protein